MTSSRELDAASILAWLLRLTAAATASITDSDRRPKRAVRLDPRHSIADRGAMEWISQLRTPAACMATASTESKPIALISAIDRPSRKSTVSERADPYDARDAGDVPALDGWLSGWRSASLLSGGVGNCRSSLGGRPSASSG